MYCQTSSSVQLEIGNARRCSPGRSTRVVEVPQLRPLAARVPLAEVVAQAEHALLGARAAPRRGGRRRSTRRAGAGRSRRAGSPSASRLRDARGPVSAHAARRRSTPARSPRAASRPASATSWSRKAMTSGKLWPVSTCSSGNGTWPARTPSRRGRSEHDRVLAAAEQQRGALALGGHLADDVDRLGLERLAGARGPGVVTAVATCSPHSVLSWPAQRPSRPVPGFVHGAQPIDE